MIVQIRFNILTIILKVYVICYVIASLFSQVNHPSPQQKLLHCIFFPGVYHAALFPAQQNCVWYSGRDYSGQEKQTQVTCVWISPAEKTTRHEEVIQKATGSQERWGRRKSCKRSNRELFDMKYFSLQVLWGSVRMISLREVIFFCQLP